MPLEKRRDELVETPGRWGIERAEAGDAVVQGAVRLDAAGGVLQRTQGPDGVPGERLAGVCRSDPPTGADEQIRTERRLELANLLRDGGLGDPQMVGRGRERPELRGGTEAAELLQRHKLSL
jgi:hypothetical protein